MTFKKLLTSAAVVGLVAGCTGTVGPGGDGGNPTPDGGDSGVPGEGGSDAAKEGGEGGGSCPIIGTGVTFAPPASCDTCMGDKCCAVVTTCFSDKGDSGSDTCVDYDDCLNPCVPLSGQARTDCVAACDAGHPNSKPKWVAVGNCRTTNCANDCP